MIILYTLLMRNYLINDAGSSEIFWATWNTEFGSTKNTNINIEGNSDAGVIANKGLLIILLINFVIHVQ